MEAATAIPLAPEQVSVAKETRPRMSDRDRNDLDWFLGVAQSLFERSTFGNMLEHQSNLAFGTEPCRFCKGTGFGDDNESCPSCRGMAFITVPRMVGGLRTYDAESCRPCKGAVGRGCELCNGTGRIEPWTVRIPSGAHEYQISYEMADLHGPLLRHARVGRHLERVRRAHEFSALVLAAYHSDRGARWGRMKQGRNFVLYPLTPSGKKLLRIGENRSVLESELTADERLGVEWEVQQRQPKDIRRLLFSKADAEAQTIHRRAEVQWVLAR